MKKKTDPFLYGTVVKGKNFFDRREECDYIIQTLSGGNNIVLYSPRRFGKTSLVFNVMQQMEKNGVTCVYFDFMPVYSPESFVRLYTKAISARQGNLQKLAETFTRLIKTIRPVLSVNASGETEFSLDFANSAVDETVIASVLDLPERLGKEEDRVAVFFDEFQEVEKLKGINFESLLRSKIQQREKTSYLFLGSKTHLMEEMFTNKKRAFYNSASVMSLGPLPEGETIEFLTSRFAEDEISLSEETARYILEAAASIPHYIQHLASELWQCSGIGSVISKKLVDFCVERVTVRKGDYYMELFTRQSQRKKQLLQALCMENKNIFSGDFIARNRLVNVATVQMAVKDLINEGIVEKSRDEYYIADPFFRRYLIGILSL